MGLCALELDRVSDAISHLEQALSLPEMPAEQQVALRFDLGRSYQQQGDLGRARESFEAVAAVDPDFGGVGERIAELDRCESSDEVALAAEQEEEAFESFDDFIGGVEPQTEAERYESFDDLISEDDDEDDDLSEPEPPLEEPEPEAVEIEAESVPEPEPEAVEIEAESVPEPEPEAVEIEAESVPEPEPEELEMQPAPEPEAVEIEAEPVSEPEPEAVEVEPELAPKQPSRRKKISFV
jgi:tetratricopeptide (TPR) repeat protein